MTDRIEALRKGYKKDLGTVEDVYNEQFEKLYTQILKEEGLYETDVIYDENQMKGRLEVFRDIHNGCMIVFRPYKKDETLSKKISPIYAYGEKSLKSALKRYKPV